MARRTFKRGFKRRRRPVEWYRAASPHQTSTVYVPLNFTQLIVDGTVAQTLSDSNIIIGDEPWATQSMIEERKTFTIDRIVGRIEVQLIGTTTPGPSPTYHQPGPVIWRWGVYVCDVDENGAPLELDRFDLFSAEGMEVEWMHRETLCLGTNYANTTGADQPNDASNAAFCFPADNCSRAPWGMVDIPVKRHVGQEQRLRIMHAAEANSANGGLNWNYSTNPGQVMIWQNLRVLGHWTSR